MKIHTRIVDTQNKRYNIHSLCRCFWHQIHRSRNTLHLLDALKAKYIILTDWEGKLYCGLTLDWNYKQRTVTISIPNYVSRALHKSQHQIPKQAEDDPYPAARIQYGAKPQYSDKQEQEPILFTKGKKKFKELLEPFHSSCKQLMLPC